MTHHENTPQHQGGDMPLHAGGDIPAEVAGELAAVMAARLRARVRAAMTEDTARTAAGLRGAIEALSGLVSTFDLQWDVATRRMFYLAINLQATALRDAAVELQAGLDTETDSDAGTGVGVAGGLIRHGHAGAVAWLGLVLAASGLISALVLRRRSPRWYWICIGYPVCWWRMVRTWRALCVECELTTARRSGRALLGDLLVKGEELRPRVPRLLVGRPRFTGMTARVRLLPGQTPDAYQACAEAMAHTWRVHAVRVTSPRRGQVHLTVTVLDPLAQVIVRNDPQHAPGQDQSPGSVGGRVLRLVRPTTGRTGLSGRLSLALVVGIREDGRAWVIDLRRVPH